jgi:hypothetical protein
MIIIIIFRAELHQVLKPIGLGQFDGIYVRIKSPRLPAGVFPEHSFCTYTVHPTAAYWIPNYKGNALDHISGTKVIQTPVQPAPKMISAIATKKDEGSVSKKSENQKEVCECHCLVEQHGGVSLAVFVTLLLMSNVITVLFTKQFLK